MAYRDPEKLRAWKEANKEHLREYSREYARKYRAANRAKVNANARDWQRQDRASNPDYYREKERKRTLARYDLTPAQWQQMLDAQNGLCAICRLRPAECVDHDHQTGQVRSLLCQNCNFSIGQLQDNWLVALQASEYLFAWKNNTSSLKETR